MTPIEGLLGALRRVAGNPLHERDTCALQRHLHHDNRGRFPMCDDCREPGSVRDVARRALAEWDARPAPREDDEAVTEVAGVLFRRFGMSIAELTVAFDIVTALESHWLGPRTPATPGATEPTRLEMQQAAYQLQATGQPYFACSVCAEDGDDATVVDDDGCCVYCGADAELAPGRPADPKKGEPRR